MVSVIAASAVDCGFKPRLGQTKVSKTDNCYFSAKHEGVGANNGWLGIRNVSSGMTRLGVKPIINFFKVFY